MKPMCCWINFIHKPSRCSTIAWHEYVALESALKLLCLCMLRIMCDIM